MIGQRFGMLRPPSYLSRTCSPVAGAWPTFVTKMRKVTSSPTLACPGPVV